jgi:hypothetical protein
VQRGDVTVLIGRLIGAKTPNSHRGRRDLEAIRDGRAPLRLPPAQAAVARVRWREGSAAAYAQWRQHEVRLLRGLQRPAHTPGPAAPQSTGPLWSWHGGLPRQGQGARSEALSHFFSCDRPICPKPGGSSKPNPPLRNCAALYNKCHLVI